MDNDLFELNMELIGEMDTPSGSLIKTIMMTLLKTSNGAIELKLGTPSKNKILYTIIDPTDEKEKQVKRVAELIGARATGDSMEVRYV